MSRPTSVTLRGSALTILCGVTAFLMAAPARAASRKADEEYAIRLVAQGLRRLGENKVAERLVRDYYRTPPRIDFKDLGGKGIRAETGKSETFPGNSMTLDAEILHLGESRKLLDRDPYRRSSALVGWVATVYHEYVHMDQDDPGLEPRYEDPAWRACDTAMVRWIDRLDKEAQALLMQPDSPERTQALTEVANLLDHLRSEIGGSEEGRLANIADGVLSAGYAWKAPGQSGRAQSLATAIRRNLAGSRWNASSIRNNPHPKAWARSGPALVEPVAAMYQLHDSEWYQFTPAELSATGVRRRWHWKDPPKGACQGDVTIDCSWSPLPDQLVPGETLRLDLKVSASASQNCGEKAVSGGITAHVNGSRWDAVGVEGWSSAPIAPALKTIEYVVPRGSAGAGLDVRLCVAYAGCATTHYSYP